MILTKHGKSYDTSNGSEQYFADSMPQIEGQVDIHRWEDDGGALNNPSPLFIGELNSKPSWSVLSLQDLNGAIRRAQRHDDPWRVQMDLDRVEHKRLHELEIKGERFAARASAELNRYRNPWEHDLLPSITPSV